MGTSLTSATAKALFDSTHFADLGIVTIKLKVTDTNGGYYEAKVVGQAYNRAYIAVNHTLPSYGDELAQIFGGLPGTFNQTSQSGSTDNAQAILNTLSSDTVFYIHTHANPSVFGDCNYDGGGDEVSYYGTPSIFFNLSMSPASKPPYNLAFILGCNLAGTYDPTTSYFHAGTGASAFGIQGLDRAFLGTQDYALASDWDWSESVWNGLTSGLTLFDAVLLAQQFTPLMGEQLECNSAGHTIYPRIIGDANMTFTGVYPIKNVHASPYGNLFTNSNLRWYIPL